MKFMITANFCKLNSLALVCEYCEEHIEPLLLKQTGPIYYGKYNAAGTVTYHINKLYAAKPPRLVEINSLISPKDIKRFLENLGYIVEWVKIDEPYCAGYSSTGRTKYYNAGYNTYWSLKISY
jgi:hypothetical protein